MSGDFGNNSGYEDEEYEEFDQFGDFEVDDEEEYVDEEDRADNEEIGQDNDVIDIDIDSIISLVKNFVPRTSPAVIAMDVINFNNNKIGNDGSPYMSLIIELSSLIGEASPEEVLEAVSEEINISPVEQILILFDDNSMLHLIDDPIELEKDIFTVAAGGIAPRGGETYNYLLREAISIIRENGYNDFTGLAAELVAFLVQDQIAPNDDEDEDPNLILEDIITMLLVRGYTEGTVNPIRKSEIGTNNYHILDHNVEVGQTLVLIILGKNAGAGAPDLVTIVDSARNNAYNIIDIIIISDKKPTHNVSRDLNYGIENSRALILKWQYTPIDIAVINPTQHVNYDTHVKLSREHAATIIASHKGGVEKFPTSKLFDPVCVYLGFRVGDLIKVSRRNAINGKEAEPIYRLVSD